MYKKGKYVLVIGAVVVVLLMVSGACAVNVETPNIKIIESEKLTSKSFARINADGHGGFSGFGRFRLYHAILPGIVINMDIELNGENDDLIIGGENIETPCTVNVALFIGRWNIFPMIGAPPTFWLKGFGFGISY